MANDSKKKKDEKPKMLDRFFKFLILYAKPPTAIDMAIARGKADRALKKVQKIQDTQDKFEKEWEEIEHLTDLISVTEMCTPEYFRYEQRLNKLLR